MADNDVLKRYLEAGMAFTEMTRKKAEALAKDLIKSGDVQREQASEWVEDLVERSRRSTEALVEIVRTEVRQQLDSMGLATRDDLAKLARRFGIVIESQPKKRATKSSGSGSSPAKKSTAKKATAKKSTAKKATAKKSTAKKATAKKSTAKKATANKSTAKKSTAKKA
jgi:polyhydroxyalkanoate synthesis regulator phasin